MSAFVLIVFLKWGYAGGTVVIPYADETTCERGRVAVTVKTRNVMDAFCIPGGAPQ